MKQKRHGLMIGIERVGERFFISLRAVGKLTHEDYLNITPMIDKALASVETPVADVLLDATELDGWEMRAAWDDFKLGLKHGKDFHRIAIVGNRHWQELAASVGGWFISGEARYFEAMDAALDWLQA
jgi:hypothetical protein